MTFLDYILFTFSVTVLTITAGTALLATCFPSILDKIDDVVYRFKNRNKAINSYVNKDRALLELVNTYMYVRALEKDYSGTGKMGFKADRHSISMDCYYERRFSLSEEVFNRATEMLENSREFERSKYYYGAVEAS